MVSNYYPIFATKFKTAKHPLFKFLGNNAGSHIKNNTDISKQYAALYIKHREDFISTRNKPRADVFAESADGEARVIKPKVSASSDEDTQESADQIKKEFERSFLDNLKSLNK